jgi:spore photoproduct lyase
VREPIIFSNFENIKKELATFKSEKPVMFNAGELSDGLAFDNITNLSVFLYDSFQDSKHFLLFLTKSNNIGNLLKLKPIENMIISFSINAAKVSNIFEIGSPGPIERIEAALKLKEKGWNIRLRLDPMIPIDGWEKEYLEILEYAKLVESETLTIGSLRWFPQLENFCKDKSVFNFEKGKSGDGRYRLNRELRKQMYSLILNNWSSNFGICKEEKSLIEELNIKDMFCNCMINPFLEDDKKNIQHYSQGLLI